MKKLTFTIVIASLFLFFSCSKDNETSSAGTSGALGVTGSGIYYQFAGGYGYYNERMTFAQGETLLRYSRAI